MNTHRFTLILPNDLWEKIKFQAKEDRRAITQEIILAIEEFLEEIETLSNDPEIIQAARDAEQAIKNGDVIPLEDALK